MEEAIAQLDQAIERLSREILRLRNQGVRSGAIESYSHKGRTYYNYTYYREGAPIRKYLPLKQKPDTEAEIRRGRQVEQIEAAVALLQKARQELLNSWMSS